MKKAMIPAAVLLVLSLVVILGEPTFLSPCAHADGSFGACHWAGRAALGLGALIAALAALALALPRARLGLYLGAACACVLGILTPGTLISLCGSSAMRCRMVMQPALILLFSAALLCAALGALLCRKEKKA